MRAFLELTGALKGTIVVALRRARPTTLAIGGAVAALVLGGLVVALRGAGGGGADDLADSRSGAGAGAAAEGGAPSASDPEAVDPDGRPLIDGVATRLPTDPGGGTDGTPEDVAVADGGDAVLDVGAPARGEVTAPPAVSDPETSPESTSTSAADPDSSTTTEGSTTTTTADSGSSSSGGLLAGVLDLLGLG